jgi:hypothetical protein
MSDSLEPFQLPFQELQPETLAANDALNRDALGVPDITEREAVDQTDQNFDLFDADKNGALTWSELSVAGQSSAAASWMRENLDVMSTLADVDIVTFSGQVTPRLPVFQDDRPADDGITKLDIRAARFVLGDFPLMGPSQ